MEHGKIYETHYFTRNKSCPCLIGQDAVNKAREIFNKSHSLSAFALEMDKHRVIGKLFTFDERENTLFITKQYACESGGGCAENKTLIGVRCHCDHYNSSANYYPKYYCKCGAEFYRPMFAPLFGNDVLIEPYNTVLSGDDQCIIAVRIGKREEKSDDSC